MVLEENDSEDSPPIPPPRPKRRNRTKLKNLSLERNNSLQEDSHQNDILFQTESPTKLKDSCLKGDEGHFPKVCIFTNHKIKCLFRKYFRSDGDHGGTKVSVEAAVGSLQLRSMQSQALQGAAMMDGGKVSILN